MNMHALGEILYGLTWASVGLSFAAWFALGWLCKGLLVRRERDKEIRRVNEGR